MEEIILLKLEDLEVGLEVNFVNYVNGKQKLDDKVLIIKKVDKSNWLPCNCFVEPKDKSSEGFYTNNFALTKAVAKVNRQLSIFDFL